MNFFIVALIKLVTVLLVLMTTRKHLVTYVAIAEILLNKLAPGDHILIVKLQATVDSMLFIAETECYFQGLMDYKTLDQLFNLEGGVSNITS